jgi:hypothetical protein
MQLSEVLGVSGFGLEGFATQGFFWQGDALRITT